MERNPCVYILTNRKNGTLYVGVTSCLVKRVWQHKQQVFEGFTKKYHLHRLVYFEMHQRIDDAIKREKQIKKWYRQWKIELIEQANPNWNDLYGDLI